VTHPTRPAGGPQRERFPGGQTPEPHDERTVLMPRIPYNPGDSQFGLPEGDYRVRFLRTEGRPPYDGPSKFSKTPSTEPRLEWFFEVLEGPFKGKTLTWTTGTLAGNPKSNCFKMLRWLLGRNPAPGESVDTDSYVGWVYDVEWRVNPDSDKGNCRMEHMRLAMAPTHPAAPAPAPANGIPAPPPRQGPPPRPGRPPAPAAAPPPARYWVQVAEDGEAQEMDLAELTHHVQSTYKDAKDVPVCQVGTEEWKTAADFGCESAVPF
jgi:hypothetical protein